MDDANGSAAFPRLAAVLINMILVSIFRRSLFWKSILMNLWFKGWSPKPSATCSTDSSSRMFTARSLSDRWITPLLSQNVSRLGPINHFPLQTIRSMIISFLCVWAKWRTVFTLPAAFRFADRGRHVIYAPICITSKCRTKSDTLGRIEYKL